MKNKVEWFDFWNALIPYMSIDGNGIHPDDVRRAINSTFKIKVTRNKKKHPYSCEPVAQSKKV